MKNSPWVQWLDSFFDNRKSKSSPTDQNRKLALVVAIALTFDICGALASAPARAAEKLPRVGILFIGGSDQPHLESFKQGLRERGYSEGKNIIFVYRYAEGKQERLADLAAELVGEKVDVIVTTAAISALAARRVTRTLPIVMTSGNPLETGLADSLAKPGGNVTGLTLMLSDLSVKRLELLKESFPKKTRVAALWSPIEREAVVGIKETTDAAKVLSLRLHVLEIKSPEGIDHAFSAMTKARDSALVVILSPLVTLNSKRIVDLALKHRLPGIYPTRQFVEEGGLMAYGPLIGDLYRRAATYVDKILKGTKPAELPIEQPMKFDFIVNLKTAKQIGVTIPPNVVVRADKVIR
ncbi:MAG TPA: ABC transporter substrate-binding protein [Candidatus Limnocylindrales bacterium]|nr:ABC transporter substrate-binding protein [Candidatus Limnocylindrales bacterium]